MRAIRDSGVEWIGEIPAEWKISKISRCYFITLGKMLAPEQQQEDETLENYLCAANVKWEGINTDTQKQMWFNDLEKQQYRLSNGDLLIMEGGMAGTSCIYRGELEPCYFQNSILRCRAKKGFINQFLYYWLFFVYNMKYVENICNRATILHYTKEKVSATPIAFPPIPEQTAIASYLDKKCSNIDAIITKNEQIIEKLKEYKSSLITETVTKGLNPDVEMKDSGVEWIGKIPVEWKISRLKWLLASPLQYGANETGVEFDDSLPRYIRITDITEDNQLKGTDKQSLAYNIAENYLLNENDILFARSGATVGKTFFYKRKYGKAAFAGYLIRAEINSEKIIPAFVYFITLSKYYEIWKNGISIQSTIQNISAEKYNNLFIPLPPLHEQTAIANYLDEKCSKIDANIKNRELVIQKLAEYKKSLIYEVVTGKKEV